MQPAGPGFFRLASLALTETKKMFQVVTQFGDKFAPFSVVDG